MTSTLHTCVHCRAINTVYLCPAKPEPHARYEYDCHTCEGFNLFKPVKCIDQAGEIPDRAICAEPFEGDDDDLADLMKSMPLACVASVS